MPQKEPLVTICMPHWQVQELITICLRAIRKFTLKIPIEVIVVDNGSEDESLDYLRGLKWIRLIERRKQDLPAFWVDGFVSALDIGFASKNTPAGLSVCLSRCKVTRCALRRGRGNSN